MRSEAEKAKQMLDTFSARGSKCPICKKPFRKGCEHSVRQARDKLFADYVKALAKEQ